MLNFCLLIYEVVVIYIATGSLLRVRLFRKTIIVKVHVHDTEWAGEHQAMVHPDGSAKGLAEQGC